MCNGSHYPDSQAGNLAQCVYESGNSVLKDDSILLWTPNKEEACRFIPVMKMEGRRDSKEFALSLRASDRIQGCGAQLILSDQGYAIAPVTLSPFYECGRRRAWSLSTVSPFLFALCDRTSLLAFALHTSLATSPALTVRNLLAREDISATFLGNNLVQLHRYMMIPSRNFQLVPFNGTCFTKPPIKSLPLADLLFFFFLGSFFGGIS
ncbi:hypothetical protein COOONC_27889 [Cooperia oncophora]